MINTFHHYILANIILTLLVRDHFYAWSGTHPDMGMGTSIMLYETMGKGKGCNIYCMVHRGKIYMKRKTKQNYIDNDIYCKQILISYR